MAVPNPELPNKGQSKPAAQPSRDRSAAAQAGSNGGPAPTNPSRPIPLKQRSPDDLPEAYEDEVEDEDELRQVLKNAPAWLVSTVFHMLLLIVLGLLAVTTRLAPAKLEVEVGYVDPADQLGTQLEDPSVLAGEQTLLNDVDQPEISSPKTLLPSSDVLAPPQLGPIKLADGPAGETFSGTASLPGVSLALSGRSGGAKGNLLGRYGGNATTEGGVELGLAWLAKQQKSDGTWSLAGPYTDGNSSENNAAATAMALLAFQGHGDTHRDGKYAKVVSRGMSALIKLQRKDGCITGTMAESSQLLYAHAQCAIALCELYGMTHDSQFRGPAQRAIAYAVSAQDKEKGGWRYMPGKDSDTSVTGWFVMALQSARMAGLPVPEETLQRVTLYLDSAQFEDGKKYGYWHTSNPSAAMCAEGLLCRQYLGWKQDDPRLVAGVSLLTNIPIRYDGSQVHDVYYWYYATQAAHHMEGQIWDDWNKVMRKEVPAAQVKTGAEAGSWDPAGDKWGHFGGRLYVTCLSIYMLEVYYRHLPIYSAYRFDPSKAPPPDSNEAELKPAEDAAEKAAPEGSEPGKNDKPAAASDSKTTR